MRQNKILFRLFLYVWVLGLSACYRQAPQQEQTQTATETAYQVIAIKDGDTIEILKDGKPLRIRLYGIDCPEKNQDFGTRARQYTSDLVFGKKVRLEAKNTDRYGRTVGIIYLPDGRSLNEELLRAGLAWHYKAYSKDAGLAELEEAARAGKRGLWAGPSPTAPWDFRKGRRTNSAAASGAKARAIKKENPGRTTSGAAGSVFLCDSKGASTFHRDRDCQRLKTCKAEIRQVSQQAASREYHRKACSVCAP
jgi:endonuclease YncB( thermonuclease family)